MTSDAEKAKWPTEPGFYLAATSGYQWWNLVVHVRGEVPYLRIDAWSFIEDRVFANIPIYDIEQFGPKISNPVAQLEHQPEKLK